MGGRRELEEAATLGKEEGLKKKSKRPKLGNEIGIFPTPKGQRLS